MKKLFFLGLALTSLMILGSESLAASKTDLMQKIESETSFSKVEKNKCLEAVSAKQKEKIHECIRAIQKSRIAQLKSSLKTLEKQIKVLRKAGEDTSSLEETLAQGESKLKILKQAMK